MPVGRGHPAPVVGDLDAPGPLDVSRTDVNVEGSLVGVVLRGVAEEVLQDRPQLGTVAEHRREPVDMQGGVDEVGAEVVEHLTEHEVEVDLGRLEGAAEPSEVEHVVEEVGHPRASRRSAIREAPLIARPSSPSVSASAPSS